MGNMNTLGGGNNNINNSWADNGNFSGEDNDGRSVNLDKDNDNKNTLKKTFEFSDTDINSNKKRQAIIDYLMNETIYQYKLKAGNTDGGASKQGNRELYTTLDRLKNASDNYNKEKNEDVFLHVVNDVMSDIDHIKQDINNNETYAKEAKHFDDLRSSIQEKHKKGEITNAQMMSKIAALDKIASKTKLDSERKLYGVFEKEIRTKLENERVKPDKILNEYYGKQDELDDRIRKFRFANKFTRLSEDDIQKWNTELEGLRKESSNLWNKYIQASSNVQKTNAMNMSTDELVDQELLKTINRESKKAELREQRLKSILSEGDTDLSQFNSGTNLKPSRDEKGNIVNQFGEPVQPNEFLQFLRGRAAGHSTKINKDRNNAENAGEAQRKAALNKRFEAMLPEQGTKARDAYDDGNGILKVILDFDLHKMHKVNVKEMARQEFLDNATIDQRNTNDYLEARAAGLGVKMILDGYNVKDFSRLKKEYGEEAALADLYCKTITMKGKLLAQYDPVEAVKLRGGSKEEIEAAKSQKGVISKEEYEMALNTLNGFARGLMDQLKEDHNLAEYSDAIDLLNNARSSEEYKNLVNGEKVRGYKENEANRLIEERKSLSKDYIRGFIDKGVFGKVKDFLSGKNVYRDSSEAKALPKEILKMQNENSGESVRLLGELHLGPIMKNFSKDLGGSDENKLFGAAYVYNELDKKRKELIDLTTSRESRHLSEQERNDLNVKAKMLYDMMESVKECYSEKAGVSKFDLHTTLVNEMKNKKLSKIRGMIRNLPFMRKG